MDGFVVRKTMCKTCIYRPESSLDLKHLENQVRDPYVGFKGYRSCHHHADEDAICCRGFWEKHKDEFQLGQVAQRLGLVQFDNAGDNLKERFHLPEENRK